MMQINRYKNLWICVFVIGIFLAVIYYRFVTHIIYPPRFYLPGLLSRSLHPTSKISENVKWVIPVNSNRKLEKGLTKEKNETINIILIIADDLGYNDLSGGAGVLTPFIDSIGENGVKFSKSYSGHATCAPSRAAIQTGRYATRFGFEFTPVPKECARGVSKLSHNILRKPILHDKDINKVPFMPKMSVPLDEKFIPEILQQYGYLSYFIGKWHLGELNGSRPMEKGYTDSLSFLHGASLYLPNKHVDVINAPVGSTLDDFLRYNLDYSISHSNGHNFQPSEYMTDYISTETVNLIHKLRFKTENNLSENQPPFFITVSYNAPHIPLQALKSDYESAELKHISNHTARVYAAMIKSLDRGIGRIIQAIEAVHETENTMIIFTSDNGGAHYLGLQNLNYPYRGWKATFFEGGIHVPLFIKLPKLITPGLILDKVVSHVDIFSTIVALASNKFELNIQDTFSDKVIDGKNLLPHIIYNYNNETCPVDEPLNNTLTEIHDSLYWRSGHYKAILHSGWKLQVSERPKKMWLIDLINDPLEHLNLIDHTANYEYCNISSEVLNDVAEHFNNLCMKLKLIDQDQVESLWPALIELAIPIDKTEQDEENESDEYVYWAN